MTRVEQRIGASGEELVAARLRAIGVEFVHRIGTPVRLVGGRAIFGEKVAGDLRGVACGGVSVLVEVKTILDRNLRYSDFRPHQPKMLDEHAAAGGISLVAWVHNSGVYIMRWRIPDFFSGQSLPVWRAQMLTIDEIRQ